MVAVIFPTLSEMRIIKIVVAGAYVLSEDLQGHETLLYLFVKDINPTGTSKYPFGVFFFSCF